MFFVHLFLCSFFIYGHVSLPFEDDNAIGEIMSNSIDGDDVIDLSGLGPAAFGSPKNESGDAVSTWTESSLVNPEEMGSYAEGDILIPQRSRNGVRDESALWPKGHIPYIIEGGFNDNQRETIMKAIADYHRLTCLRFVPRNGHSDYIVITSGKTGCWSSVGKLGGRQEVNLQIPGCVTKKGTVLHELLHAVGFFHEQSRPERDDFVTIHYNNIKSEWASMGTALCKLNGRSEVSTYSESAATLFHRGYLLLRSAHQIVQCYEPPLTLQRTVTRTIHFYFGAESNFKKADPKQVTGYTVSYDYNSVMHYSEYAFSKNTQRTIEPKVSGAKLGQREGLSRGDVKKVNNMYNCQKEEPESGWLNSIWQSMFGEKRLR